MKIKDIVELCDDYFEIYNNMIYKYECIYKGKEIPKEMLDFEIEGIEAVDQYHLAIYVKV